MASQGFDDTMRQEIEDGSQYFGDTLLQEDSLDVGSQVAHGSLGYVSPSLRRIPQIRHEAMLGLGTDRSEKKQSGAGSRLTALNICISARYGSSLLLGGGALRSTPRRFACGGRPPPF